MISVFASTMNNSATGTANCKSMRYRSDCSPPKMMIGKKEPLLQGDSSVPNADCTTGSMVICSGADNVDVEITENISVVASMLCTHFTDVLSIASREVWR